MRFFLALGLIFSASICSAQEVGSAEAYRAVAEAENQRALAEARQNESIAKSKMITRSAFEFRSWPASHSLTPTKLAVGQIGRLANFETTISDVIDERTLLIRISTGLVETTYMLVENVPSTAELVDDQKVRILDYLEVIEPRDHRGTKLYVLKMLDKAQSENLRDQHLKEDALVLENEKRAELAKLRDFRKWTAKNGNEIEAKFSRFKSPTVYLELKNGKKTSFRITALSDADAELVRSLAKEDAAK